MRNALAGTAEERARVIPELFGRVGVLIVLGVVFPALPLVASFGFYLLRRRPQNPDPIKHATYECGVESEGNAWGQFNARYYLFALGFVIFDVEVVFLYPWALQHGVLNTDALFKAAIFVGVLAFGLAYAWRRGALEWR